MSNISKPVMWPFMFNAILVTWSQNLKSTLKDCLNILSVKENNQWSSVKVLRMSNLGHLLRSYSEFPPKTLQYPKPSLCLSACFCCPQFTCCQNAIAITVRNSQGAACPELWSCSSSRCRKAGPLWSNPGANLPGNPGLRAARQVNPNTHWNKPVA